MDFYKIFHEDYNTLLNEEYSEEDMMCALIECEEEFNNIIRENFKLYSLDLINDRKISIGESSDYDAELVNEATSKILVKINQAVINAMKKIDKVVNSAKAGLKPSNKESIIEALKKAIKDGNTIEVNTMWYPPTNALLNDSLKPIYIKDSKSDSDITKYITGKTDDEIKESIKALDQDKIIEINANIYMHTLFGKDATKGLSTEKRMEIAKKAKDEYNALWFKSQEKVNIDSLGRNELKYILDSISGESSRAKLLSTVNQYSNDFLNNLNNSINSFKDKTNKGLNEKLSQLSFSLINGLMSAINIILAAYNKSNKDALAISKQVARKVK